MSVKRRLMSNKQIKVRKAAAKFFCRCCFMDAMKSKTEVILFLALALTINFPVLLLLLFFRGDEERG